MTNSYYEKHRHYNTITYQEESKWGNTEMINDSESFAVAVL